MIQKIRKSWLLMDVIRRFQKEYNLVNEQLERFRIVKGISLNLEDYGYLGSENLFSYIS